MPFRAGVAVPLQARFGHTGLARRNRVFHVALPTPRVSREQMSTRRDHPLLEAIGLTVLFFGLVAVAPGALFTFAFEHLLRIQLDLGQRWTWAIASSVVAACVMSLRSRRGSDGLARYVLIASVASAVVLVARFGTHARWASEMLREYVP